MTRFSISLVSSVSECSSGSPALFESSGLTGSITCDSIILCTGGSVFRVGKGELEREGLTFSVNILNLFEDGHCPMGENWARRVVYSIRENDRSHTRYRNAEEHENLENAQGRKVGYNEATYLMKETDMLESKAGGEE